MLLDALFRSESLENPSVPVTGEAAETDNIFCPGCVCQSGNIHEAGCCLCLYLCYFIQCGSDAPACDAKNE
ncbi:hypothetical protein BANRA_01871 [Escherichia coli]|uniref:Uncharacterized protein n=1 Tax=Escherichia coli TaxID=562 RepID=A0A3P5DQI9_ECOLX|nr:hypothetical protein BANRA_01871 [Escherichia coli]